MISYGLGDAGTGLAASQLGFYLFVFLTCTAGLDPLIAGSLLMVIKLWDGINDPLIGWLSDHTRSRWGPRLPWILGASIPLGASLAAMWWVPQTTESSKTIYYLLMAILLMTAYTSVNLPYAALSTEITTDTAVRTRLNAARFTGSILASLTGLLFAWQLTKAGESGYAEMGRITGIIATVATILCCWGLAPFAKKAQRPKKTAEPIRFQIKRIFRNQSFLHVLSLYFLLWCGLQFMQTVALIYLVQVMRVPSAAASFGLIFFQLSALIGLQFWSMYSNKHGRIKALYKGGSIWVTACLMAMLLPPLSQQPIQGSLLEINETGFFFLIALLTIIVMTGFGASTAYLIPWSLLPDAVDEDPDKPAGFYTAWMVLIQKLGIGLSMGFFGILLKISGYIRPTECVDALTFIKQPALAEFTIRLCMGLLPASLVILGLLIMRRWKGQDLKSAT